MENSIFLAKVLGLYLTVFGLLVLLRPAQLRAIVTEYMESRPIVFLGGMVGLIMGIILVVSHNIWTTNWRVVITILAWLILIKGTNHLFFPSVPRKMARTLLGSSWILVPGVIDLLLGLFLVYKGFFG
jgi:uncharacterized membrane protein